MGRNRRVAIYITRITRSDYHPVILVSYLSKDRLVMCDP
jgi:hypothetical protein